VDNPNKLTLIGEVASMEAMQAFMQNPQLAKDMEAAGVISKPEITVLKKM
jgi:quinol monooxygenase YgiN